MLSCVAKFGNRSCRHYIYARQLYVVHVTAVGRWGLDWGGGGGGGDNNDPRAQKNKQVNLYLTPDLLSKLLV